MTEVALTHEQLSRLREIHIQLEELNDKSENMSKWLSSLSTFQRKLVNPLIPNRLINDFNVYFNKQAVFIRNIRNARLKNTQKIEVEIDSDLLESHLAGLEDLSKRSQKHLDKVKTLKKLGGFNKTGNIVYDNPKSFKKEVDSLIVELRKCQQQQTATASKMRNR